jgi:2-oxoglutarate ferredoxin oxidoreductase subunit alpha
MRIPTVAFIMSRGGPSTGTVIYGQMEVILSCFGGNGNGLRIVYSPCDHQELYDYGVKVFNIAHKYKFPVFLLSDGYLAKSFGSVETKNLKELGIKLVKPTGYLLALRKGSKKLSQIMSLNNFSTGFIKGKEYSNFRNCFNLEQELYESTMQAFKAYKKIEDDIVEYENYGSNQAKTLIVSHGIAASSVKNAILQNSKKANAKLFRPITLKPFPKKAIRAAARKVDNIIIMESALGQLAFLVKNALYGFSIPIKQVSKPGLGFDPLEIIKIINSKKGL